MSMPTGGGKTDRTATGPARRRAAAPRGVVRGRPSRPGVPAVLRPPLRSLSEVGWRLIN